VVGQKGELFVAQNAQFATVGQVEQVHTHARADGRHATCHASRVPQWREQAGCNNSGLHRVQAYGARDCRSDPRMAARHLEACRPMKILFRVGALRALFRAARLSWRLVRDPRTPLAHKLFLAAALALIVSPINWLPSFIPILGQMEDLALLALALNLFLKRVPAELRREHEAALGMI
jgi:uncharacterized membrane protein YkvA (DUF1232 family)